MMQLHSDQNITDLDYQNFWIARDHISNFNWRSASVPCAQDVRNSYHKMPSESKPLLTAQTEKPNHYS